MFDPDAKIEKSTATTKETKKWNPDLFLEKGMEIDHEWFNKERNKRDEERLKERVM